MLPNRSISEVLFAERLTIAWLVCLILLLAITHTLFTFAERYDYLTDELLAPISDKQWKMRGTVTADAQSQTFRVENSNPARNSFVFQQLDLPSGVGQLILQGAISTEAVIPGKKQWNLARVVCQALDANGKWIPVQHVAVALDGDNALQAFSGLFQMPERAVKVRIAVQLLKSTGRVTVSRLSLRGVQQKDSFTSFSRALMACWALFMLWSTALVLMRAEKSMAYCFTLVFAIAILSGTLISLQMKSAVTQQMEKGINYTANKARQTLEQPPRPQAQKDKRPPAQKLQAGSSFISPGELNISGWGHGILFMLLTISALVAFQRHKTGWILLYVSSYAVMTETLQHFAIQRTPNLIDLAIDFTGIATGLLLLMLWKQIGTGSGSALPG